MTKDEKFERLASLKEGMKEPHKPKLPSGAWRGLIFALLFEAIILLAWWLAWRVI